MQPFHNQTKRDKAYFDKKLREFTTTRPNHTVQDLADFASGHGYYLQINFMPLASPAEVIPFKNEENND